MAHVAARLRVKHLHFQYQPHHLPRSAVRNIRIFTRQPHEQTRQQMLGRKSLREFFCQNTHSAQEALFLVRLMRELEEYHAQIDET